MAAQEVVTLTELKAYIPLTDTADDALLTVLLAQTIAQAVKYIGTPIVSTAVTDEAHTIGYKQRHVCLRQRPATSITVKENGETLTADEDYGVDDDNAILTRLYAYWYPGNKMVKVSYTAGWTTVPDDIKFAIMQQAKYYYLRRDEIGLTAKSLEGSISMSEGYGLLKSVRELLNPYRVTRYE